MGRKAMLGIDLGGSGFRVAAFDAESGELLTDFMQFEHGDLTGPDEILPKICAALNQIEWKGPIGLGFPGAVDRKKILTAPNIGDEWLSSGIVDRLESCCGGPVTLVNDADAVAIAEFNFGSGQTELGTVLTLTIGTGLGTTIHRNGELVPNLEYGLWAHPTLDGTLEEHVSGRARSANNLSLIQWAKQFQIGLNYLCQRIHPDLIILYGGIMEHWADFRGLIQAPCPIQPATHQGTAGVLGAAFASIQYLDD